MGRPGFQRLLAEVSLDHVGVILGAEMSRLARSNKDWHHLLELCSRFGTLIADLDGLYDPYLYNDRLLLGLKGTMSEAELHVLRQRLLQGKLQKARRGELGKPVPSGYLRQSSGQVVLDPDEHVRAVVHFVFEQFERIGTTSGVLRALVRRGLEVGVRRRVGPDRGQLEWHRPHRGMVMNMVRNPIYAGAYVYGRRQTDPRRQKPGRPATGRTPLVNASAWLACVRDALPAYISWEQFDRNQRRLDANRQSAPARALRDGAALLQGLVVCGRCRRHMSTQYATHSGRTCPRYVCNSAAARHAAPVCANFGATCLDHAVTARALAALAPAAIELSLRVADDVQCQRTRDDALWQQRLARAHYEAERAARQYHAVEPENRLVARSLEHAWEQALVAERQRQEEYARYQAVTPRVLTRQERALITALATDLPALWSAATTTNADRKQILRFLIERVVVIGARDSEWLDARIEWVGGAASALRVRRPVHKLRQLSDYAGLMARLRALRTEGLTASEIAARLNAEGWTTPTQRARFNARLIRAILERHGSVARGPRQPPRDIPNAWWLTDLATKLKMSRVTLYGWVRRGWVRGHQVRGDWVVVADAAEVRRLRTLRRTHPNGRRLAHSKAA